MNNHDVTKDLENIIKRKELFKKISPKFDELSLDVQEIMNLSKDPVFISLLLFKLVEEREKTNKLLEKIYDKFDAIMLELKTANTSLTPTQQAPSLPQGMDQQVLPEQDQMILHLVKKSGQVEAKEVKAALGYKGLNAASQRLNKLFKEGYLQKIQSGRKVFYLARTH